MEVDAYLKSINDNGWHSTYKGDSFNNEIVFCIEQKFVLEEGNKTTLTSLGREIIESGGYEKWKTSKDVEKQLEAEIKTSTLEKNKMSIWQLRFWWIILIVNAVISIIISLVVKAL